MKKLLTIALMMLAAGAATAALKAESAEGPKNPDEYSLNFNGAPADLVLAAYAKEVGKTLLVDPACPKNVTISLKSPEGQTLTREEYLEAIKVVLEMYGIHLEDYRKKFIRALPRSDVRKEGIPLVLRDSDAKLDDGVRVVSAMIKFEHLSVEDAQKVLDNFKSKTGVLISFERTRQILVTDTALNIKRMLQLAKEIDVPLSENEIEQEVIQIKYASASDIKTVLEQIVQDSQKWQEKDKSSSTSAADSRPRLPGPNFAGPGGQPSQKAKQPENSNSFITDSDADRGIIRGRVTIVADERSNQLVIITSPDNLKFFKTLINSLDVVTTPDTVVDVFRLKYAEAEDVSDMLNDLIGNSSSSKGSSKNQNQNAKKGTSTNLRRGGSQTSSQKTSKRSGETKAGELSKDNTTVLADKRINGIVVMTDKELLPTISNIIEQIDVKLSQVLIETVIIEVQLGDDISTGIDWVHGIQSSRDGYRQALGGGGGSSAIAMASATTNLMINAVGKSLPYLFSPGGAGLTYGVFSENLNLGAVIQAAKTDSHSKYLASPVIMTVDNKEATINTTSMKYLLKGFTSSGNSYSTIAVPDYEQKELGIEIKVKPKINQNGTVMLTVETKYSQEGASQTIKYTSGGSNQSDSKLQDVQVPTSVTREMSADVLLDSRQTVVFGGLTETEHSEKESGIPILKDIPYIGKYLFGSTTFSEARKELLVFMTPYVLDADGAAQAEALRRKKALSDARPWDDHGWSASKLADPISEKEQLRRLEDEADKQDEDRQTKLAIEKWKVDRAKKLQEQAEEEQAELDAEKAKKADKEVKPEAKKAEEEAKPEAKKAEEPPKPEGGDSLLGDIEAK